MGGTDDAIVSFGAVARLMFVRPHTIIQLMQIRRDLHGVSQSSALFCKVMYPASTKYPLRLVRDGAVLRSGFVFVCLSPPWFCELDLPCCPTDFNPFDSAPQRPALREPSTATRNA
jgi:hypothetical protein